MFVPSFSSSSATPTTALCTLRAWQRLVVCWTAVWTRRARKTGTWSPDPSCMRCTCCAESSQRGRGQMWGHVPIAPPAIATTTSWRSASSLWAAPASDPTSNSSSETQRRAERLLFSVTRPEAGGWVMPKESAKFKKEKYKKMYAVILRFTSILYWHYTIYSILYVWLERYNYEIFSLS